jgi:hypothetical protein
MNRTLLCQAVVLTTFATAPLAAEANKLLNPFAFAKAGAKAMYSASKAATKAAVRGDLLGVAGHFNPANVAVLGYQHLTAPDAQPHDPGSWAPSFTGHGVAQRGMVDDDGKLYMRTQVQVFNPGGQVAQRAEEHFRGEWSAWGFGGKYTKLTHAEYERRTGRKADPDAVTYELKPPMIHNKAPGGLIKVNEQLRTRLDGRRLDGELRLDGHVVGPAHVGVKPDGSRDVLEGGFDGVEIGGLAKLLGPGLMGAMHGAVEYQGFGNLGRRLGGR